MDWASLRTAAQRFATQARTSLDETTAKLREDSKGVAGSLRESFADAATAVRDMSNDAATTLREGVDAATAWVTGEEPTPNVNAQHLPTGSGPSAPSSAWRFPRPEKPPRLEDLRKGSQVYRKGQLAEVVKVDYEADPPSLVVRMMEAGNEVGTDAAHVSLGPELSQRCLTRGVRVSIMDLQGRKELNGCRGVVTEFKADVVRWTVLLDTSGEAVSVRPQNLSVLLTPSEEAAAASTQFTPPARSTRGATPVLAKQPASEPVSADFSPPPSVPPGAMNSSRAEPVGPVDVRVAKEDDAEADSSDSSPPRAAPLAEKAADVQPSHGEQDTDVQPSGKPCSALPKSQEEPPVQAQELQEQPLNEPSHADPQSQAASPGPLPEESQEQPPKEPSHADRQSQDASPAPLLEQVCHRGQEVAPSQKSDEPCRLESEHAESLEAPAC